MPVRKRLTALVLAVILCLSLCGCGLTDSFMEQFEGMRPVTEHTAVPRFEDISYLRPDTGKLTDSADSITKLISKPLTLGRLMKELDRFFGLYYSFYTMDVVAGIHSDIDTSDSYYLEESAYCSTALAEVNSLYDKVMCACAYSRKAKYLDKLYFGGLLGELRESQDRIGDKSLYTDQKTREAELLRDSNRLLIEMEARESSEGTEVYADYVDEIGGIYIELVKLRRAIAENCGADSYKQLCIDGYELGYTPEELSDFVTAINEEISPVFKGAVDAGLFSRMYTTGELDADSALDCVKSTCGAMGDEISEALGFMLDNGMYSVSPSETKLDISYVIYLEDYESPFLFVKPEGFSEDILTIAHEFGHYVDGYVNFNDDLSLDSSEMFSQGMEYLLLARMEDEALRDELTRYKMLDLLYLYVNQAAFFEFEDRVYTLSDDELTTENICSIYTEEAEKFGFGRGDHDSALRNRWIGIVHFFEQPFYVISYCISDSAAMTIYNMELHGRDRGLNKYLELVRDCAELPFVELLNLKHISSPVSREAVERISLTIRSELYG